MSARPKLTFITPSFNQGGFLERTLQSALNQGYENLEYLVVDGGATNGSVDIILRYEDRLAWWVSESDEGRTDALNRGLRRATGDVIAYINSADYCLPREFDRAIAALTDSDTLWAVAAANFVDPDDRLLVVWKPAPPHSPKRHWWLVGPWGVPQGATFWRRRCFDEQACSARTCTTCCTPSSACGWRSPGTCR